MNYEEFKQRLGAEPDDPALTEASKATAEHRHAYASAQEFELQLKQALSLDAESDLLDRVLAIPEQAATDNVSTLPAPKARSWMPLAMAASLIIAVAASVFAVWQNRQFDSLQEYVVAHYHEDGLDLIEKATAANVQPVAYAQSQKIMSALGANISNELAGRINFIKFCPTPEGKGAHMVVMTESGPTTIIYMPKSSIEEPSLIQFDDRSAYIVNLQQGAVAVIGQDENALRNLGSQLQNSIRI